MENYKGFVSSLTLFVSLLLVACGGEYGDPPLQALAHAHRAAPSTSKVQIVGKRSQFSVHRLESGAVVQDQTGKQSRYNTNELVFDDLFFHVLIKGQSNSMDKKDVDTILELYLAYFNRLPDADGPSYWLAQRKSGMSVEQIGYSFYAAATLPEFSNLTNYGANMSSQDFVKVIYKNVL